MLRIKKLTPDLSPFQKGCNKGEKNDTSSSNAITSK